MTLSAIQLGNDFDFAIATDGDDIITYDALPLTQQQQLAASVGIDAFVLKVGNDTGIDNNAERIYFGNQGNDSLFGNGGDDTLAAGRDNDFVSGGDDDDLVFGNLGDDILLGGDGEDTLFGGQNNDWLYGQEDEDFLSGDRGNDTLNGGGDDDTLVGGDGNDVLSGNDDDDLILGGFGVDDMRGGEGDDTLIFRSQDAVTDILDADAAIDFDFDDDILAVNFNDYALDDSVDLSNLLSFNGENGPEVDTVVRIGQTGPIVGVVVDITARDLEERMRSISIPELGV
ncbi:calcium-binding protein [Baaleninema sp.]|uniref:calcium-binding protein n=1 Tax=Baaleninema sp. TaxID=3101197 RepID=UPI003CFD5EA0